MVNSTIKNKNKGRKQSTRKLLNKKNERRNIDNNSIWSYR